MRPEPVYDAGERAGVTGPFSLGLSSSWREISFPSNSYLDKFCSTEMSLWYCAEVRL